MSKKIIRNGFEISLLNFILKIIISNDFLWCIIDFHIFFLFFFFITYNDGKSKVWRRNIIKDLRNLFRPGKLKQLKIKYLDILRIFLSIKEKKVIINQQE